jgi:hypothetical protein
MLSDSITEEIRGIRRKLAARFDNDLSRIFADVRQHEASDGRTYITLPRRPVGIEVAEQTVAVERRNRSCSDGESTHAAH